MVEDLDPAMVLEGLDGAVINPTEEEEDENECV